MYKAWNIFFKSALIPASISLRAEKGRSLIVIHTMYFEGSLAKEQAHLRAN
jgi:hypothetical protein